MKKYRPINERVLDYKPVEMRLSPEELAGELKRCQDCGIPFCHATGCPLGNAIPEINAMALAGRWNMALATLLDTSPFPEFTARVCPALCEGSCVQGMHEDAVPCRQVEKEVIERGFASGLVRPRRPATRCGLSASVIGSGPAVCAAAWRLNLAGVNVTVYEKDFVPGGVLRYGIPDFKLEKEVVDRRVEMLAVEGIVFECGVDVGRDISGRLLLKRHDLIIIASGSRRNRDLPVPGRDLAGVHFALDYLSAVNRANSGEARLDSRYHAGGKNVVVIGGGDTGSDCVGTARRQGAASVLQVEIMPEPPAGRSAGNPWPQWPVVRRDSSSHEEGCERRWNVSTLAFIPSDADQAALGSLRCALVEWKKDEGNGVNKPHILEGSEFSVQADMALLAMGFTGPEENPVFKELEIGHNSRSFLRRDQHGRASERVYVCGDAASGPSLVVRAIADGLSTAETVLADHLEGAATGRPRQTGVGAPSV
ncbi:MAG: glutamate synthase subunit beta [Planctomycetes bacterium]|nr:glutamate synthase subunit beta [Planctomycetota bacterium]